MSVFVNSVLYLSVFDKFGQTNKFYKIPILSGLS